MKFPSLVQSATDFIKSHSFEAHNRRRETTGTGTGVSLKDLQKHLLQNVPGLREHGISRDTIHHLMIPPRKLNRQSIRYAEVIDARISRKRNNYWESNVNQHFLFLRAAYREEFCSMFAHESKFYSADVMNKIKMGPATAVSRYHQQHRFYMTSNSPNLHDHDFPNPGYLIICSGYQLQVENDPLPDNIPPVFTDIDVNDLTDQTIDIESLPNPEAHPNPMMSYDRLGRTHYKRSKYGPAVLKLRAYKFGSSSAQTHANDLAPILSAQVQDGKTIAFIKVDNGPDWNILNVTNAIYFGRMWRDTGLDILGIASYAAQWSAYNNIEHLWSPISKRLANVVLPYVLDDDQSHPCQ